MDLKTGLVGSGSTESRELDLVIAGGGPAALAAALYAARYDIDRFGIVFLGECVDKNSSRGRRILLEELNNFLPKSFAISMRKWDTDASLFNKIHCSIGYLKHLPFHNRTSF